jgi:tRNA threonylcarbamoyladenosine biosynthesis protein TsaB
MNILIVDSSKKRASVQVVSKEKSMAYTLDETEKHSENLLYRIDQVLDALDLELGDIDVYATIVGPGSFTGIRVGLSTIKAFNLVNNKKLISVNAFEPFLRVVKNGIILLNSTRTSFYYALVKGGKIYNMDLVTVDALFDLIDDKKVYMLDFEQYKEFENFNVEYINNYSELLRDAVMLKVNSGDFVTDEKLEPLYLQLSQAEVQLNKK